MRRQSFIDKVDARILDYDVPIRQLRSLSIIDNVPNYQSSMIDYLHKQLLLTRSAINQRLPRFRETLESSVPSLESVTGIDAKTKTQTARAMSDMTGEMIRRMEYVETRFHELETLGIDGNKVIQSTQHALPKLQLRDLKAFQVTPARHLCVQEGDGEAFDTARELLDTIVDAADLHIQSCTEALADTAIRSLEERIDVLNSLVDQFSIVDQRLLDLHAEYPEQVQREPWKPCASRSTNLISTSFASWPCCSGKAKRWSPSPAVRKPHHPQAQDHQDTLQRRGGRRTARGRRRAGGCKVAADGQSHCDLP